MPIQSYVTDEELERILGVIDTETETGKRNRAIILVGATTGLRAIDIIRMKLTDIDWRKGEIKLVQSKTGTTTHVPLMKETGEALKDYILNTRPKGTGCGEVFLRVSAQRRRSRTRPVSAACSAPIRKKPGYAGSPLTGRGSMACAGGWQRNCSFQVRRSPQCHRYSAMTIRILPASTFLLIQTTSGNAHLISA